MDYPINICVDFLLYIPQILSFHVIPGILLAYVMARLAKRNPKPLNSIDAPKANILKQSLWTLIAMFGGMFVIDKTLHEQFKQHRILQKAIATWVIVCGVVVVLLNSANPFDKIAYDNIILNITREIYTGGIQLRNFPSYEIYHTLSKIDTFFSCLAIGMYIGFYRPSLSSVWFKIRKCIGLFLICISYTALVSAYTWFGFMSFVFILFLAILLLIDYKRKNNTNKTENVAYIAQVESESENIPIISNPVINEEIQKLNSNYKPYISMKKFKEFYDKITKLFVKRNSLQNNEKNSQSRFSLLKRILFWCLGIIVAIIIFIIVRIIYVEFVYPKRLNRIDEQMIYTAQNDSTQTIEIAQWFLKNSDHSKHHNFVTKLFGAPSWSNHKYNNKTHKEIGQTILREAAEKGNADAQFAYAKSFFIVEGWCEGLAQGKLSYRKYEEIKEGFIAAWNGLDTNLEYSLKSYIRTSTFERAAYWLKKSADNGNADAAAYLGFFYEYGLGVKQDLWTGQNYTLKAAEGNSACGIYRAGNTYSQGIIVISISSDGDSELYRLKPDIKEALRLWKIAADRGYEYAKVKVEKIYDVE